MGRYIDAFGPLASIFIGVGLFAVAAAILMAVRESMLERRQKREWRASRDLPNGLYAQVVMRRYGLEPVCLVGPFADDTQYRVWHAQFDDYRKSLYYPHECIPFTVGVEMRVDPSSPKADPRQLLQVSTHNQALLEDPDPASLN